MQARRTTVHTAVVIDETTTFTLGEICQTCNVHAELVIEMVAHGLLEPRGESPAQWEFTGDALRRSKTALRLQRDLGINLAGTALVLDLLDELEKLRVQLALLNQ